MRIVDFQELCKLPSGVIFSNWKNGKPEGLMRRGDPVCICDKPWAFRISVLVFNLQDANLLTIDIIEVLQSPAEEGQQYAVYEQSDISTLSERVAMMLP